jgi:hypothetical protein
MIKHIETLLTAHDCVILPRFGAFIVNHISAAIVASEGQLNPPQEIIYFNRSLQYDDGLLIETWRLKEKISYQKASRQVEKFVLQLKQQLIDNQTVPFGQIGTFFSDEHLHVAFHPASSFPFLPDNIGLEAVKMPAARKHHKNENQVVIRVPSVSKYIAAAVAMLLLMFVLPIGQFHTETNYAKLNPWDYLKNQWMSERLNIVAPDSNALKIMLPATMRPLSEPVAATSQSMEKQVVSRNWYIVVGTFHTEKQALLSSNQLEQENKINLTVIKHHNLYRIIANRFASRDSALTVLRLLRKKPAFNTAWIVYNPSSSSSAAL